ncbi:MAG: DUF2779 domain-containing protein, partial [Pseudomonadota bacterium]
MRNVSKEIFLNTLICTTLGWLMRSGNIKDQIAKTPLGEKYRKEEGIEIGKKARELFPDGILVDDRDLNSIKRKTEKLINDTGILAIFEGGFVKDGFAARPDVLTRKGRNWQLFEVKSSVNDKPEFLDDMAFTTMVIDRCGYDISNVSLLLLSKDFRLGMSSKDLFIEKDCTDNILNRVDELKPSLQYFEEITRTPSRPEPQLRYECRNCDYFTECFDSDIDHHIFDLPRLSKTKFTQLMKKGITEIKDIPDDFSLTEQQKIVRGCVKDARPYIGDGLKDKLRSISWPAYYLDFETVQTGLPLYPDIPPYTQIPTQYSIHKCSRPGNIVGHYEYLADPVRDCRKELAQSLIRDLDGKGSILVYSNFEKTIISGLQKRYPELSSELKGLKRRLVDLEAIIKKNFYHPDFHGSTS